MEKNWIGVSVVAALAVVGALAAACSSSSGGSGPEDDAGTPDAGGGANADASPWCLIDDTSASQGVIDECSRNPGECLIGSSPVSSCPSANLAGCCKGTSNSPGGVDNEICVYSDDYLAVEGGAQAWCTCMPVSAGCFGGTWQTSP
jgi:hypothetical protein